MNVSCSYCGKEVSIRLKDLGALPAHATFHCPYCNQRNQLKEGNGPLKYALIKCKKCNVILRIPVQEKNENQTPLVFSCPRCHTRYQANFKESKQTL